jgi:hypothetical protein
VPVIQRSCKTLQHWSTNSRVPKRSQTPAIGSQSQPLSGSANQTFNTTSPCEVMLTTKKIVIKNAKPTTILFNGIKARWIPYRENVIFIYHCPTKKPIWPMHTHLCCPRILVETIVGSWINQLHSNQWNNFEKSIRAQFSCIHTIRPGDRVWEEVSFIDEGWDGWYRSSFDLLHINFRSLNEWFLEWIMMKWPSWPISWTEARWIASYRSDWSRRYCGVAIRAEAGDPQIPLKSDRCMRGRGARKAADLLGVTWKVV